MRKDKSSKNRAEIKRKAERKEKKERERDTGVAKRGIDNHRHGDHSIN